jgi:hypothetical protein
MKPLSPLLIGISVSLFLTSAWRPKQAHAIAPAIAAYGTLEVILLGSAAAAAAGIITVQQNAAFQSRVAAITRQMTDNAHQNIENLKGEVSALYRALTATTKKPGRVSRAHVPAPDADCKEDGKHADPRECCKDWLLRAEDGNQAEKQGYFLVPTGNKAYQVYSPNGDFKCCLEWDNAHGRFEVYTPGGDGKYLNGGGDPYSHKGELTCKDDEVKDPCRASHPERAENGGRHAPREGCHRSLSVNAGTSGGGSEAGAARSSR